MFFLHLLILLYTLADTKPIHEQSNEETQTVLLELFEEIPSCLYNPYGRCSFCDSVLDVISNNKKLSWPLNNVKITVLSSRCECTNYTTSTNIQSLTEFLADNADTRKFIELEILANHISQLRNLDSFNSLWKIVPDDIFTIKPTLIEKKQRIFGSICMEGLDKALIYSRMNQITKKKTQNAEGISQTQGNQTKDKRITKKAKENKENMLINKQNTQHNKENENNTQIAPYYITYDIISINSGTDTNNIIKNTLIIINECIKCKKVRDTNQERLPDKKCNVKEKEQTTKQPTKQKENPVKKTTQQRKVKLVQKIIEIKEESKKRTVYVYPNERENPTYTNALESEECSCEYSSTEEECRICNSCVQESFPILADESFAQKIIVFYPFTPESMVVEKINEPAPIITQDEPENKPNQKTNSKPNQKPKSNKYIYILGVAVVISAGIALIAFVL